MNVPVGAGAPPTTGNLVQLRGFIGVPLTGLTLEEQAKIEAAVGRALANYSRLKAGNVSVRDLALSVGAFSLTAALIGWFIRAGGFLATLLSSVSVMREVDPLVVVTSRRRRRAGRQPESHIDLLFSKPGLSSSRDAEAPG